MSSGERRIPTAVPLFAALIFAAGVALWPGGGSAPISASGAVDATELPAEPEAFERSNAPSAPLTEAVKGIIRRAVDRAVAAGAQRDECDVSVLVKELGVKGSLVELQPDRPMKPASNLKLATTAVALALLGSDAQFETQFQASAHPSGGVLAGDLIVRAGGDPLYAEELAGEVAPLLAPVVEDIKAAGVERIEGDLVLDLGLFSEAQPAPGWPSVSQHWKDYCALSSGFTANAGCISLRVTPGAGRGPAAVEVSPRGHGAVLELDVKTLKRGEALDLKAVIQPDLIKVWGDIPLDVKEWTSRYAHPDPVGLFGAVLRRALEDGGVSVSGRTRLAEAPSAALSLATLRTPVLSSLTPINTHSNNSVADQLFLKVGCDRAGAGDRDGGAAAALYAFGQLGVTAEGYKQVDGSGLSRNNRISARQIVTLLDAVLARGDEGTDAFMDSLALAGVSGTLSD